MASTSVYAFWSKKTEVEAAFCRKLQDERVYDENDLEPYKMLISGTDDWIFRSDNDFRTNYTLTPAVQESLLRLQRAMKSKNIDLVIAFPPARGLVHAAHIRPKDQKTYMPDVDKAWANYEQSIMALRAKGLNIVGVSKAQTTDDFFYKRNHHWTATGAYSMARNVSAFVKTLPSWKEIPKAQFKTTATDPAPIESSFEKAFKKICDSKLPPEEAKNYTTASVQAATSEQSLFNEQDPQQVVLLGTSNSVQDSSMANFEGFLKEGLSTDIMNLSYIAGGIDTSIISFLNSAAYKNGGARIVIWEVPGYYDFNIMDDKLFAQLVPAVNGSCSNEALAVINAGPFEKGRTTLFDFTSGKPVGATPASATAMPVETVAIPDQFGEKYVHISFADGVKDSFRLRFDYGNAGTQVQEFNRSDNYPTDGEFYTMMPQSSDSARLKKIILETKNGIPGNQAQVEICPLESARKDI
jgi:hypothetical protein